MVWGIEKTKICFVIFGAYPLFNPDNKSTFGGAEVDLYNLAVKFAQDERYEVSFIVGDYGQKDEEIYENVRVIKQKYVVLEKSSKLTSIKRILSLIKTLFFLNADIYFTETASDTLGWLVLIEKFIKRKKVLFRIASDVNTDLNNYRKEGRKFFYLYKLGLLNSDVIISQSEYQRSSLEKNCNINSTIIKNAFFIKESPDISEKGFILWVGRCIPVKRPDLFIELAKRVPEESFVIIMPSYEAEHPSLKEWLRLKKEVMDAAEVLKNIKHIEYVPFWEISKYYEKAKLFVNTSEYEGFPNTFIQACLGRTPILSFNVDPDNFITGNKIGHVCNNDIGDAVSFIKGLNRKKIICYGENAYKYVLKNHNIENIFPLYEELFKNL